MNFRRTIAALVSALLAACAAPAPTATSNAMAPAAAPKQRESAALCLASVDGRHTIDRTLQRAQRAASLPRATSALWVAVGGHWLRKARLSGDSGFYLNVDACVDEALVLDAGDTDALALRGLSLINAHRFDAARQLALKIIEQSPRHVVALGILSDALLELGEPGQALAAAQRQMSAHPGMAADARGSYLAFLHGDSERAKLLIRDALYNRSRSDPEAAAWAFVEAARLYWQQADYAGADALLVEAMNWVGDYPAALNLRARIALAQDDPERAIDQAMRAHAAQPAVESAWILSDAHRISGSDSEAHSWFERARRIGEQSDHLTLGLMLAMRDVDPAHAVRAIEFERRSRGGIYVDDAYAWALYRADRLPEARRFSEAALHLGTQDARLLFHAGAIRIALGEHRHGRVLLERALALNPEFDPFEADVARELLATQRPELVRASR